MDIRLKFALAPALFTLFAVCMPPAVMAEHTHPEGNLLFFVSGQAHHGSDVEPGGEHLEDAWGRADIVFSASRDRWRLFGEYSLTTKEHDLERFQIGFEPISDSILSEKKRLIEPTRYLSVSFCNFIAICLLRFYMR